MPTDPLTRRLPWQLLSATPKTTIPINLREMLNLYFAIWFTPEPRRGAILPREVRV